MKLFLFILLSLFFFSSQAELYKWVDENGEIVYSDEPPHENAEPLVPPPLSTTPAFKHKAKAKMKTPVDEKEKEKETLYSLFNITSPVNNEIIRDNAGNFSVSLELSPELDIKAGHTITILVDSQSKIQGNTGLTVGLKNINRGAHAIQAVIKNKQKKIIQSTNSVTIHMRRTSIRHKQATP